jgi:predicted NACHT family NTPase
MPVDLRAFSSDALLHGRVFGSPEFTAWQNGNTQLTLSLDSLDEALLRIDNVAAFLADGLPRYPTTRMSIRIACRTAVWPHELLEPTLKTIWSEDAVGVFELAPLRRKDVAEAAQQRGIDPTRFIDELQKSNAVPFALKPLRLNLLFEIFTKDGRLPDGAVDLYSEGCLRLCEELSQNRRAAGRLGRLNGLQRKRLASRIAAVTMLANQYAISTNPDTDSRPEEDVPLSALSIGSETGEFQPFDVSDGDPREVLDTGLFSSRGVGRMGWAHQT